MFVWWYSQDFHNGFREWNTLRFTMDRILCCVIFLCVYMIYWVFWYFCVCNFLFLFSYSLSNATECILLRFSKWLYRGKKMVFSMCLFWFFFFLLICLRSSIRMNLFHFSTRCNSLFGLMSLKYSHGFVDFVLQWIAVLKHVQ